VRASGSVDWLAVCTVWCTCECEVQVLRECEGGRKEVVDGVFVCVAGAAGGGCSGV